MWVLQGSRGIKRGVLHRCLTASNVSRRSDAGPKKASVPRTFSRAGEERRQAAPMKSRGTVISLINPPKNQSPGLTISNAAISNGAAIITGNGVARKDTG